MSTTWFVTGASSGIGAAIVDASLARSDTVVATFRDAEGAQRFAASSAHAIGVLADVRSTEQVDAAVAHAVDVCDEVPYLVDHGTGRHPGRPRRSASRTRRSRRSRPR